ncbi:MAG: HAMP domain-containing histidine kinase [Deltaproteobacteria bacterium]|nr:HAMP domain-containing histidine kinase [Deltaproteobacteria bacterium]
MSKSSVNSAGTTPDGFLSRITKFYRRTQKIIVFFVLFPTIFTTAVGILGLVLYDGSKDIIFGVLTISFMAAVLSGSILAVVFTSKASESASRQTAFLANITHDLRSPLTAIKMFAQTLKDERVDEDGKKLCVEEILKASERLEYLVQQILQWRRIVSGREHAVLSITNPNDTVLRAVEFFGTIHPDYEEYIKYNLTGEKISANIDSQMMTRALLNLIDNAYKYSFDKSREITISTYIKNPVGKNSSWFVYEVRDNGIGISRENIEKIFDVFYRVDYKLKGKSGTGLGLSIVKSIVQSHKGELELDSELDAGSRFIIKIPLDKI